MQDPTETIRREMVADINENPNSREALTAKYGAAYNTTELQQTFEVIRFGAPFCEVKRKEDGAKGTLEFQHDPRLYYNFQEEGV